MGLLVDRPKRDARLLWVDLEMTGLEVGKDHILEVAAIVTNWKLEETATYEAAVRVDPATAKEQMFKGSAAQFWGSVPETRDALLAQNQTARPVGDVEKELIAFIEEHCAGDDRVVLAGNSIHMDRQFIDATWPTLASKLHYRMLDVTSWKLVFEGRYRQKFAKNEAHRALDDIRGSIEELTYYLGKIKEGVKQ